MYFAKKSRTYGDLYVPACTVALGSSDSNMLTAHGLAATSVSVDLGLSMSGTFSFSIANTFDPEGSEFLTKAKKPVLELLTLGTQVWISMGYGDSKGRKLLLSGYITGVGTGFAEGGSPTLEISGFDSTYLLKLSTKERQAEKITVQAMVSKIAGESNLTAIVSGAPGDPMMLSSNMQNDLEFLGKLARQYCSGADKFEFYARPAPSGDKLHFGPRRVKSAPVGTLTWGVDLLSFSPEIALGEQVSKVMVHGWDRVAKKKILGVATREPGATAGGDSGGAVQKKLSGKEAELDLRAAVKTQKEADDRAAAELADRARGYVGGSGETFGFPALLPDTVIELKGVGTRFSKKYYVSKTVHRFDASGYRTRFTVERTTI